MKLILSQYVRSLKERDDLDRLLPDLLLAMGFVPISKPQPGVRQHGVDLAVVGVADDGVEELRLFVIKGGNISRSNWDSGPQSVRKRIVVAASGDMKQEVQINWDGYTKNHSNVALFRLWGADQIAVRLEKYLLNENIFASEDRTHLRKALALAGEVDYDQRDLHRLFRRQLGLGDGGEIQTQPPRDLLK